MAKSKAPKNASLLLLMGLAGAVVGGLVAYIKLAPADVVPAEIRRTEPSRQTEAPVVSKVTVFTPVAQGDDVTFDERQVDVPKGTDPAVFAVNEFLRSTTIVEKEARLVAVDRRGKEAILQFNSAFNQTVGTGDEKVLLDGIRKTMGQFSEIESIRFEVEGQPMETLGNVELDQPIIVIR
ncbi:MAG TPA: GerMN domain-containing protein [Fimbriimonadaceae bacterium]|nr:GerMN domain-containing protein [Fimbriimonadaceae bacterium]